MSYMRYVLPIICITVFIFIPRITAAETLRFTTIDYCPFSCDPTKENGREGFMTDILRAALEEAGHSIEVTMLPYLRSVNAVVSGDYDGIIVIGQENAPDLIYPEVSIGVQRVAFFTRAESDWKYSGVGSLPGAVIGIVSGYDYIDSELNQYFSENSESDRVVVLHGKSTIERGIKMLQTNRIDSYFEGEYSILYALEKLGIRKNISIAGYSSEEFTDITGFSLYNQKSAEYAQLLSDKIREMRQSGEYKKLIGSYGITSEKIR
jgi:polar amino acid transport system substrate-binding protein